MAAEDVETRNGCTGRFEHRLYFDADSPPGMYQLADMADPEARLDEPQVFAAWAQPCIAAMRIVAGNLDAWERRHRTELDTIRAAWRQRVTDAARLPR